MGQESEYRKEDKKEEGAGGEMGGRGEEGRMGRGGEDGERRGAAEKNTREFSLNLSAEKSFLTVTQNQPREKKP